MKIATNVLYLFLAAGVASSKLYRETHSDRSIGKVLRSIACEDVIIRIRERRTYDATKRLLEVVSEAVTSTWPSQIFVSEETESVRLQGMASSRTLLIYLYESDNDTGYRNLSDTLMDVRSVSHPKHVPKLLLMVGSTVTESNALRQLRHLWDLGFFDAIVMEVSSEPLFVAAHSFNGFNEDYAKLTEYDRDIDWYPDKARNMYGNALKVTFAEKRSYGSLEDVGVSGLAEQFSDTLETVLNATVSRTSLSDESDMVYDAHGLVYSDWYSTRYEHTVAVGDDRICLLIPKLPADQVLMDFWQIVVMILMGLLLAAITWCASIMLRLSKRMRDPLNTIGLILGISPLYKPRGPVEKVLFVALTLTAAEYTYSFQTTLFNFVIEYAHHKRVFSFEDLYRTELKVLVSPVVYNELRKDIPPEFLKSFTPTFSFEEHLSTMARLAKLSATSRASKAYFMSELDGKLAEMSIVNRKGNRLYQLCELCIMSHHRVHSLPVRSPYRSQIDGVLLSLMEYGFARKHAGDLWRKEGEKDISEETELVLSDHSVYVALAVLLVGHAIAIAAFCEELAAAGISRCRHSLRIQCPRIIVRRSRLH